MGTGRSSTSASAPPSLAALRRRRDELLGAAAIHGARNVRVFGSVARGEADEASDVDFLVDMEPGRSLLDLAGFLVALRELLGWEIDVVTERALRDRVRGRVLREAVALEGPDRTTRRDARDDRGRRARPSRR